MAKAGYGDLLYLFGKSPEKATEAAIFAAGCFWGVEEKFRHLPGVLSATAGYTGGHTANPSYEDVCSDTTGHAEAVRIEFDPSVIGYAQLLDAFWNLHDPTQVNRQGPDFGTQYRSAIFTTSPKQEKEARASKEKLQASGRFSRPIATEIVPASTFYKAEEYHQRYLEKHGKASCG